MVLALGESRVHLLKQIITKPVGKVSIRQFEEVVTNDMMEVLFLFGL